mmetsp:Transcript_29872/g.81998  ORF Transcript_29872/g.81998 Transcript_29872/m.81998 type:complete len:240 (+) Transcript_29872:1366-2085(+)
MLLSPLDNCVPGEEMQVSGTMRIFRMSCSMHNCAGVWPFAFRSVGSALALSNRRITARRPMCAATWSGVHSALSMASNKGTCRINSIATGRAPARHATCRQVVRLASRTSRDAPKWHSQRTAAAHAVEEKRRSWRSTSERLHIVSSKTLPTGSPHASTQLKRPAPFSITHGAPLPLCALMAWVSWHVRVSTWQQGLTVKLCRAPIAPPACWACAGVPTTNQATPDRWSIRGHGLSYKMT